MLGGPLVHLFGEGVVFAALTLLLQTLAAYGVTTDSLKPRHLLAAMVVCVGVVRRLAKVTCTCTTCTSTCEM